MLSVGALLTFGICDLLRMFLSANLPQHIHLLPLMFTDLIDNRGDFGDGYVPAGELIDSPAEAFREQCEPFQQQSVQSATVGLISGDLCRGGVQQLAAVFFGPEVLFEVTAEGAESFRKFSEAWHAKFTQLADPFSVTVESVHQRLVVCQESIGDLHERGIGGW
jgi:hypothetical protein